MRDELKAGIGHEERILIDKEGLRAGVHYRNWIRRQDACLQLRLRNIETTLANQQAKVLKLDS